MDLSGAAVGPLWASVEPLGASVRLPWGRFGPQGGPLGLSGAAVGPLWPQWGCSGATLGLGGAILGLSGALLDCSGFGDCVVLLDFEGVFIDFHWFGLILLDFVLFVMFFGGDPSILSWSSQRTRTYAKPSMETLI